MGLGLLNRLLPSLGSQGDRQGIDSLALVLRRGFDSLVLDYRISAADLEELKRAYILLRLGACLAPFVLPEDGT